MNNRDLPKMSGYLIKLMNIAGFEREKKTHNNSA